jgi:subtilisin family serine protease
MHPKFLSGFICGVLAFASISSLQRDVTAEEGPAGLHESRVNIGFVPGIPSDIDARIDHEGGVLVQAVTSLKMAVAQPKPGVSQSSLITGLQTYSDTLYVTPDVRGTWLFTPNDHYFPNQRDYLTWINVEAGWDETIGTADVLVGVIDTGVYCLHEDFSEHHRATSCRERTPLEQGRV